MADILVAQPESQSGLYTCLSCTIAFLTAQDQREHYRSDHHRYNMKRRVAGLPPVGAALFNQKVLDRRAETAIMTSPKGSACEICSKSYTTENAYRAHLASKKHKENELRAASKARARVEAPEELDMTEETPAPAPEAGPSTPPATQASTVLATVDEVATQLKSVALQVDEDATEEQINQTIDEKIAAARARISPTQCLFCSTGSASLDENLTHMSTAHSFFIPDAEYLVDLVGLITYLGEKIAVGNTCVFCSGRGREFRTLEAVRKHMLDKGHCKIAYDSEEDRLEISDFYDFTASYPDVEDRTARKAARAARRAEKAAAEGKPAEDEEWEDDEEVDDSDVDEVVEEETSDESSDEDEDEDEPLENEIAYGDSHFELVLPSGARIGHRSMRRYYAQSFPGAPRNGKPEDPNSGAALVRRLLADKNSALVPRGGGFGAFGAGFQVVKARNRGEAREAGRHVREHRDQRRKEDFKTKVGFRHNNQKHFRDPLLQ